MKVLMMNLQKYFDAILIKVFIFLCRFSWKYCLTMLKEENKMEILQTTAKMQQTHTVAPKQNATEMQSVQQIQKAQIQQDQAAQVETEQKTTKIDSQEQMEKLIDQLNRSLDPFNTTLRFGFDNTSEDFYVSVIETKSNRMVRRFPVEQAVQLLPKMEEVNGLLFDQKG